MIPKNLYAVTREYAAAHQMDASALWAGVVRQTDGEWSKWTRWGEEDDRLTDLLIMLDHYRSRRVIECPTHPEKPDGR